MAEVTQVEPWSGVQPYLTGGFAEASNLYDTYEPAYYSGETQAGFSPDQLTAQAGIRDWAGDGSSQIMNQALGAYGYGTGSSILDVANNPYVQGMAQAAARDAYSGLGPQFSNIRGGAIQSGGYGGGRQGIAEGTALAGANQNAMNATANIYGNAYSQGLGHQANVLGQTGSIINSGFAPYEQLNTSGSMQTGREQALLEDAQAKHEFTQQLPYEKLNQYMDIINGSGITSGGYGTTTAPGQSTIGQIGDLLGIGSVLGIFS
jgi:hypothetical protein